MFFKQVQLFNLTIAMPSSAPALAERLEALAFIPCLPSLPTSMGWVSPIEEEGEPLARGVNGCFMICLQIEEKILPANVVGQMLKEKIKQIEIAEARKVRQKEKLAFKDEIIHTLLPRAFTKLTRIYAYLDTKNQWLILNTTSPTKTDLFISMLKKSLGEGVSTFAIEKLPHVFTRWLKFQDFPSVFAIEKACVLQDPNQQHRIIRCQQQDLFATSIQALIKDGCEVIQLAVCWGDRLNFVINHDFSLRGIRLADSDIAEINDDMETKQQRFDADLVMMTEMFAGLMNDLLEVFIVGRDTKKAKQKLALVG